MAELGETSDPVALVPGSPDGIDDVAAAFTAEGERFDAIGRELRSFSLRRYWIGEASDRFDEIFAPVPTRWYKTSDALSAAAAALTSYAETLRWAQGQAREAIALWGQGEAAELRRAAREILDRARAQLDEAGCAAAQAVTGHGAQGTAVSTYLTEVLVAVTRPERGTDGGSDDDWVLSGLRSTASFEDGAGTTLGSASTAGDADGNRVGIGASAEASASVDRSGLHGSAEGTVGATGEFRVADEVGAFVFAHEGSVLVGGRGEATVDLGDNGLHVETEAFVGARAEYGFGAETGAGGMRGTAEGWAGAGVAVNADLGYENGRFTIDLDAGAALGVGGRLGGEVTIDPGQLGENLESEFETLDRNTDYVRANDDRDGGLLNDLGRFVHRVAEG